MFVDWCTVPDPTNPGANEVVRYKDGQYITLGSNDVTLYAQWAEGVTVTYRYDADKDGVYEDIASEMKKQIVGKGTETPMMHTGFTNGSMALIKWNTDPDLVSGDTYEVTGKNPTITVDADTTLYAVWESGWNKMGNQSTSTVLWKVQGGNTIRVRPMDGVEGSFVGTGNSTWIGLDSGSRGAITKVSNEGLIYASGDFYNHFV